MSYSIQQVFNNFKTQFFYKFEYSNNQSSTLNNILKCRTEKLGTRIYQCEECGKKLFAYNSCRDRHCPNCQDYKKEVWIQNHKEDILNIKYFHVVVTVPAELRPIFYHNQRKMYNFLFKASSEALIQICEDEKNLGAKVGITSMLHTWTQKGNYHPHIHMLVTGGGLDKNGNFKKSKDDYLVSVKALSRKFRGKLLDFIKKETDLKFYGEYKYLNDKNKLNEYLSPLYDKEWVCYSKPPFNDVNDIYEYLARYAFKVCMSNERIVKIDDTHVWFTYRDRNDNNKKKTTKIKGEEFIRRFLMHVLPKSFMKIRNYGIIASKGKKKRLEKLKKLTKTIQKQFEELNKLQLLNKILGRDITRCTDCNGLMTLTKEIKPHQLC